jgi:predicted neuraminidase
MGKGCWIVHRWAAYAIFLVGLILAFIKAPKLEPPAFVLPAKVASSSAPAEFSSEMLPATAPMAHGSSLTVLEDGRLAAAWYAGSRETAPDVKIWLALRDAHGWSTPRVAADPMEVASAIRSTVQSLGNPVITAQGKRLHLWFVCITVGGWSGSSILHRFSEDDGQSWSAPVRLTTSAFFNLGTLTRNQAVALANGEFGLPVYHELFDRRAEWLRIGSAGQVLAKVRMPSLSTSFQPAVVAIDRDRAFAVQRSSNSRGDTIAASTTADGGASWQAAPQLPIANYDDALALLRLAGGRLLLAANPHRFRNFLQLFLSEDDGVTWRPSRIIEDDPDRYAEYSYPALAQTPDGLIHLLYTYRRATIAHAVFNEATLQADSH